MSRRPSKRRQRLRQLRAEKRAYALVRQWARQLFSSAPPDPVHGPRDEPEGGLGVREPRRPVHPRLSGGVALDLPSAETRDLWAVGEER
jgi:hypothetical protein